MPNKPKTVAHTVRVGQALWDAAKLRAEERGETISEVIRRALERYTKGAR